MLKKTISKRVHRSLKLDASSLVKQVKNHVAWKGKISLSEAAKMLESNPSFTFVLSQGFDEKHFILSYVGEKNIVKHKNIRIQVFQGQFCFLNGSNHGPFAQINDLLPRCLRCSPQLCKPLV